jgi:protein-disulfide isomerase
MATSLMRALQVGLVSIGAVLIVALLPCTAATQPPEPGYVGAAKPDVTILEYFDYNCPYCRKFAPVLRALLVQERRVAVIYKEWPIAAEEPHFVGEHAHRRRTPHGSDLESLVRASRRSG